MVLLDLARQLPGVRLIVAHVNHGIRQDATEDAKMVRAFVMSHNILYEEIGLNLGDDASEDRARQARYNFLRHMRKKYNALAILTAHHKNDVIETAAINMVRGTGWRGLSSLDSTPEIIRPLLAVPKIELQAYAELHAVPWRHDSTNDDTRYLRNRVRHKLLGSANQHTQENLYRYIVRQKILTDQIDNEVAGWIAEFAQTKNDAVLLPRHLLIMMPENVAHELLQGALRQTSGRSATRPLVRRALVFVRVAKSGKMFPIDATWQLRALPREVIVERRPDVVS